MTNRFKGLNPVDRVPEELMMEISNIVQKVVIKPSPRNRNARRQSGSLRRLYKWLRKEEKQKTREKGKDTPN